MNGNKRKSGSAILSDILTRINTEGGFPISIITDKQGFPIASASLPGEDPETKSAVVALVQKTAAQVQAQLGMAATDEISLYDAQGQRLVCRPFVANGYDMILAVMIPNRNQSYRRITNQAIRAITEAWRF